MDYLDAVRDQFLPELRGRPLSVMRVLRGQEPFMQKNVPKYTPPWVRTVRLWAESSRREVSYALCDDRRTLLWFGNQRAVEYHPTLSGAGQQNHPDYLVMDIDPPSGEEFRLAVRAAQLVREALSGCGLAGAVKTSGAKGVHVFVPITQASAEDAAAATRAVAARAERLDPVLTTTAFIREDREGRVFLDSTRAGGATVAAAYSPRIRPGVPVSFPLPWDELDRVTPADFTVRTAARLIASGARWAWPAAPAPAAPGRPDRGRPHHPDRPGPGHARRQTPRPGPPRFPAGATRRGSALARGFPGAPAPGKPRADAGPGYRPCRRRPKRSQQKASSAIHSHGPNPKPKPNHGQCQNGSPGIRPCQVNATTTTSSTMGRALGHCRLGRGAGAAACGRAGEALARAAGRPFTSGRSSVSPARSARVLALIARPRRSSSSAWSRRPSP